ncbi:MAG TPA: amidohydrolase family protein [bacterium]|nr:amidohydrolase family protein [bacterium]
MKNLFIVDGHMHSGKDPNIFVPSGNLENLLATMQSIGIGRAYSSHYSWLLCRFDDGYRESIKTYEQSDGKILFLGVYDPREPEISLKYFDRCLNHPGFIGIKIHPSFHEVYADDPAYLPVWDYARKYGLPILAHTWSITDNPVQKFSVPSLFKAYVDSFQDVPFIMGHCGGRGAGRKDALSMAKKYPNAYIDIAGDIFCHDLIPSLVEAVGAEKIIFGSDWPWFDPMCFIPRIMFSPVTDEQKKLILGINAIKVFEPGLLNGVI